MNILFVHQNFPGQFKHVAVHFVATGHNVAALAQSAVSEQSSIRIETYSLARGNAAGTHPWATEFESKTIRGQACAEAAERLKASGFVPDVIFAHPGWGETLFLSAVFPAARLVCLMEFYYRPTGQDLGFDPEFSPGSFEATARLAAKNANLLLAMEAMDQGIAPTAWQASTLPVWAQQKTRIIHEGIDTDLCRPDPSVHIEIPGRGVVVRPGDEVLTFSVRNLEPVRGYHIFMRALPRIMAARPQAKVFIIGGDGVSYGSKPAAGSYRDQFLKEVGHLLDPDRVFFLGKVPYRTFLRLMQVSRCHVYLTYPFVLSWSLLEAMSCGAMVVGSATTPVLDAIKHESNGLLVDFFDTDGLAAQTIEVLAHPERFEPMRRAARQSIIDRFDLHTVSLPAYTELLKALS